jgi:mono/diheme cytochrome c family protein
VCHADNGGGDPKFHGIMYPRPTDLRSDDTQEISDGELYWVIKNGVRWSGMTAFGKPGDDDEHAWKIVAYVRHLPKLTLQEQQEVMHQCEEPMEPDESSQDHSH